MRDLIKESWAVPGASTWLAVVLIHFFRGSRVTASPAIELALAFQSEIVPADGTRAAN